MAVTHFAGKTIVVTGANRGIGLEFVKQLLAANNHVIATVRDVDKAGALKALGTSGRLTVTQLDLTSSLAITTWAHELKAHTQHVDVVFNNAGVFLDRNPGNVAQLDADVFLDSMKVNALAPMLIVQQLLKNGLIGGAQAPSIVVNLTTGIASFGDFGLYTMFMCHVYRASKTALNMLTKSSAAELAAANVQVAVISPGYVDTDMSDHQGVVTTADSVIGMLKTLDNPKHQPLSGRFLSYDDRELLY